MEFEQCVKERRSIRRFTKEPVYHDAFERAVALASWAPSWKNGQIARYTLVEDPTLKAEIAQKCVLGFAHNAQIILEAPALVALTYVTRRSGFERNGSFSTSKKDGWEMFDAGIACQTFCLAAHAVGLGSVIMGIFDEEAVRQALSLPEEQKVGALIAIGVPGEAPNPPKRKTAEELISYR